MSERQREREPEMGRDDDRGGLQDTIPAGWDVNGVLEGTNVDELIAPYF